LDSIRNNSMNRFCSQNPLVQACRALERPWPSDRRSEPIAKHSSNRLADMSAGSQCRHSSCSAASQQRQPSRRHAQRRSHRRGRLWPQLREATATDVRPRRARGLGRRRRPRAVQPRGRLRLRPGLRGSIGSDGFETVLIGTRGAREAFLDGWKGRAARTASDWAHLLTFVDLFAFHPFRPLHPLHPLVACSVLFPCLGSLAHSMLIRTPTACRSESEHLDGQKTCTIRAHAKSA
jgi:hypothetical protein